MVRSNWKQRLKATKKAIDRRGLLAAAGLTAACSSGTKPAAEEEMPSELGSAVSAYGERSKFETTKRLVPDLKRPQIGSTTTPLADTEGMITPASLHFERHHAGVPEIDPAKHTLLVHGLVERPTVFTLEDLKRLPSVSRIHFVECSGNSGREWKSPGAGDVQKGFGLASCSEWTGVPVKLLLEEVGRKAEGKWVLAEGADACRMFRSLPVEKVISDGIVVYAQNGEAIRPSQGYPLRLLVPGYEGNTNVKWLRQLKVVDQAYMAKDETSKYTDLMPDGKARMFTFVMDAKSVITTPSGGRKVGGPGFHEIRGLAWTGRGRIEKVEVSVDGGKTWKAAELQEPRLPMAFTRFRMAWEWDGQPVEIMSRATDESGYVQPSREELTAARGMNSNYHYNGIKAWRVKAGGEVESV
ncbi:MAG: sulfite dehydrogenase [Acidobacteria bacterium]|nr:sulfite dehydrogenase [Acidobacteriota bacterium]